MRQRAHFRSAEADAAGEGDGFHREEEDWDELSQPSFF